MLCKALVVLLLLYEAGPWFTVVKKRCRYNMIRNCDFNDIFILETFAECFVFIHTILGPCHVLDFHCLALLRNGFYAHWVCIVTLSQRLKKPFFCFCLSCFYGYLWIATTNKGRLPLLKDTIRNCKTLVF